MKKNKKSSILYKSVGFMLFLGVIVMVIIVTSNFRSDKEFTLSNNKMEITDNNIGYETFENIKKGNIKVACNDVKKLGALFIQINNEMTSDNITDTQMQEYAVSTPAKKAIDDFSMNFIAFLENFYGQKNISQAEAVLQAVNMEIYTNIVQTSLMIKTGNISEKEFYDYLNIEYCGATPPASYISPKDVVLYFINNSYGRSAVEELMDNTGK
ncbi:hypothetical protein [Mucispirillum schaedleri]|jgi:hypothetical protein|uniref:Uncharacterized protein n=1 Tax=Mucispirillum schaedleri ASF457 TaxID=1379858 RepID=V2Q9E8_9BACT|nr:hypothetical protein [Mucispirillum schaedleri]MCX4360039.1 hypothetical protein [Mucispirillum schaedleri]USF23268.1 hypothetical protein N508_000324 [Mucispirillum schaedleri ASF457]SIW05052.1 conserved hypothetical protein [Mucispirillum schaedleri ASF457]